ncbi:hypothetical protein [Nannocystis radixulma]|uniref:TonB C-terminal domain-containing protein n=1 Tax=Nannocystis radixulma TaxID=2995305 RepID=A0ABT5AX17_9BACT|nr:hypothetical protein [Nannocystis radixulma]MDC0666380.1 hypothetical protein [Nannocystis radixulma]
MSTSTAILLAGAMIALGLFFGLRGLMASAPEPTPTIAPAPPPTQATPAPAVVDLETSRRHVANALAYHRATLRQGCYLPQVAGQQTPPTLEFEFNFTFDAGGRQVTRGLVEKGRKYPPEITACMLAKLPALRIPQPGQVVTATIPLSFP